MMIGGSAEKRTCLDVRRRVVPSSNALRMIGEEERELFLLFASLYGRNERVQSGQLTVFGAAVVLIFLSSLRLCECRLGRIGCRCR